MEKDPTNWTTATWLLVTGAGIAAGFLNWYTKVKQGKSRPFNILELVGELVVSSIITLGVFMALESYYPVGVCIAAAGGCGHMGTRFIFLFETMLESKMRDIYGILPSGNHAHHREVDRKEQEKE